MPVNVKIPTILRRHVGDLPVVEGRGETLRELLEDLDRRYPGISKMRRVADGREYLERTLGTSVSIFVPPHNALSRDGLDAVSRAGLNLLGSFLSFLSRKG